MSRPFTPGWTPDLGRAAAALVPRYARVAAPDPSTLPPAISLSGFRGEHLEQGQAGTCHEHAAAMLARVHAAANGLEPFAPCRRLIGWQGERVFARQQGIPVPNQADGGSPTADLLGMTGQAGTGVGIADERTWPYTDDRAALAQPPPAAALDDARACHLDAIVDAQGDLATLALIAARHPVALAHWWPYGWDAEGATFLETVGPGEFGHALTAIGFVQHGVWPGRLGNSAWLQVENWHGLLYRPLPPELAALVPGYVPVGPDRTSDYWVRLDVQRYVESLGGYHERVSATSMRGRPAAPDAGPDDLEIHFDL